MAEFPVLYSEEQPHTRAIVYGLVDPLEPARVRYVGQTNMPSSRYAAHLGSKRQHPYASVTAKWARLVFLAGRRISMVLLEEVADPRQLIARERHWIAAMQGRGQADLNGGRWEKGRRVIVPLHYRGEEFVELSL